MQGIEPRSPGRSVLSRIIMRQAERDTVCGSGTHTPRGYGDNCEGGGIRASVIRAGECNSIKASISGNTTGIDTPRVYCTQPGKSLTAEGLDNVN
jgi:hypothetical protein